MKRRLLITSFLSLAAGLPAQQPSAGCGVPAVQASRAAFQISKTDLHLLDEANALDSAFEEKGLVLYDPGVQAYVDAVGTRIVAGCAAPERVDYRFLVLRDPMVNAFSLPNGSVYINTGLLAILHNEAELASVLGHETAHVYDRHSYLESRSVGRKNLAIEIISAAAHWVPGGYTYGLAAVATSNISSLILVESAYGYSRELERQADSDGIATVTAAGYNPHAMVAAFESLEGNSTLEFEPYPTSYHDHPKLRERREATLEFADKHTSADARTGSEQEYLTALAPAIASNVQFDMKVRRQRSAVAGAARLVHAFPRESEYQMLLGEAYRTLGAKTAEPTEQEVTQAGENRQRKLVLRMSEEQEQHQLRSTPEGRATLQANQAAAEKLFLAVIQEQPGYALAYREIGFLYEDEGRYADAAANYQHYLQLVASTSLDRYRIERRLASIQSRQNAVPR